MSVEALEQAYFFALGQAQNGVPLTHIQTQLANSGWQKHDIEHISYRVNQQLNGGQIQKVTIDRSLNQVETEPSQRDGGHVSKALRQIVLNATDQRLDLDKVNFMGPVMLGSGGLMLMGGLAGVLLLIANDHSDSIKAMVFPVVIGVTFIKAGIDSYFNK